MRGDGRGFVPRVLMVPAVLGLALLAVPLSALVGRVEWSTLWADVTSPEAVSALGLSLVTGTIATMVCVVLGVPLALLIARSGARVAALLRAVVTVPLVLPLILLAGIAIGSLEGLIIGKVGVPAFVTTLACQFIFRGMLSLVTESTGTILVKSDAFNQISNGFLPPVFRMGPMHGLSLVVGALSIALIVWSRLRARRDLKKYRFRTTSAPVFWATLLLFAAVIGVRTNPGETVVTRIPLPRSAARRASNRLSWAALVAPSASEPGLSRIPI